MSTVTLNFKVTGSNPIEITCDKSISVADLKVLVAAQCVIPADSQRLIYKGKILKDHEILNDLKVDNGHTMHVVRSGPVAAPAAAEPTPVPSQTQSATPVAPQPIEPSTVNPLAQGNNPLAQMLGGQNPFMQMPQGTPGAPGGLDMESMLQNPLMNQVLDNMLSTPGMMRSIVESNPMLSQMVQSNPQLLSILENPELMRTMMSPQMMQMAQQLNQNMGANGGMNINDMMQSLGMNNNMNNMGGGMPNLAQLMGQMGQMGQQDQQSQNSGSTPSAPAMPGINQQPQQQQQRPQFDMSMFANMFGGNNFGQNFAQNQATNQNPEERFAVQLEQLSNMGFLDKQANIEALTAARGNVNDAISYLLERR